MPTYEIEQYELHAMKYRVEATSEGEAIAKLFAGEAEPVEQSQDMIEVADDYGLAVDEYPELAEGLRNLGIQVAEVIPSIRSNERSDALALHIGDAVVVSTQKRKDGPQLSNDGSELSDGGVIDWPDSDGSIRRKDKDGNTEEVRRPDDPDCGEWKQLYD
jgi:hypothetical protein